jgi:uncharacterized membrane protein YhaH (DUF805 family)
MVLLCLGAYAFPPPGRSVYGYIGLLIFGLTNFILPIPLLCVMIRRLHDTDRSGWWCLLTIVPVGSFVLLVWLCSEGTKGLNRFDKKIIEKSEQKA